MSHNPYTDPEECPNQNHRVLSRLSRIALYALALFMLAFSASGYLNFMEYLT